ncbi:MAG: hypothetical protein CME62_15640 [Halobacteriovoraceae bacterium]|nr:hypothetical protein [Halobacteriovoraceae bacterium]|tara:strand:+ start:1208 stop:1726 length:519 start_codon:yes stop_codon:yes gene_type:complete
MKTLRERLRSETKEFHDFLESQYPFNTLLEQKDLAKNTERALICFKLCFYSFLNQLKDEHEFYQKSFDSLSKVKPELNDKLLTLKPIKDDLHLHYLFLGSRMGNKLVINKNPSILEVQGGDYFNIDMPQELWKDFLTQLDQVQDIEQQNMIIGQVKMSFKELAQYGLLLQST